MARGTLRFMVLSLVGPIARRMGLARGRNPKIAAWAQPRRTKLGYFCCGLRNSARPIIFADHSAAERPRAHEGQPSGAAHVQVAYSRASREPRAGRLFRRSMEETEALSFCLPPQRSFSMLLVKPRHVWLLYACTAVPFLT